MPKRVKGDPEKQAAEVIGLARGYSVVKHNDLIQKSRHQLTLQEQKIVLYLISRIKPGDDDFVHQTFSIVEFCKICGIDWDNGKNYANIKKTIQKLRDRSVWIELDNGDETLFAWINEATISKRSGFIKIKLHDVLKPYLLQLQKNFTKYELIYTLAMRSLYSVRLYELLKSYQHWGQIVFETEELKKRLFAETYELFYDFKRYVLETATREINALTDLNITYTPTKTGRRFTEITFSVTRKEAFNRWETGQGITNALDKK